jgi:hypothetical protein
MAKSMKKGACKWGGKKGGEIKVGDVDPKLGGVDDTTVGEGLKGGLAIIDDLAVPGTLLIVNELNKRRSRRSRRSSGSRRTRRFRGKK